MATIAPNNARQLQDRLDQINETMNVRMAFLKDARPATSHPTRTLILIAASEGRISPNEFSQATGEKLGRVAYHFRILLAGKLLKRSGQRPVRGAVEHYYTLSPRGEAVKKGLGL